MKNNKLTRDMVGIKYYHLSKHTQVKQNLVHIYSRILNKNLNFDKSQNNFISKKILDDIKKQENDKIKQNIVKDVTFFKNIKQTLKKLKTGALAVQNFHNQINKLSSLDKLNRFIERSKTDNKKSKQLLLSNKLSGGKLKVNDLKINTYLKTIVNFDPEISKFQNIVYNFVNYNSNQQKNFYPIRASQINAILENSFYALKYLISRPVFEFTPNNLNIKLFYLKLNRLFFLSPKIVIDFSKNKKRNKKQLKALIKKRALLARHLLGLDMDPAKLVHKNNYYFVPKLKMFRFKPKKTRNYLKYLILFLSKKLEKPIQLDLTLLAKSYFETKIFANDIGLRVKSLHTRFLFVSKDYFKLVKKLMLKTQSSAILGVHIKKGGRLMTEPFIPKKSFKVLQTGSIKRANTDFVTTSRFTSKNKRGAFSITVTIGHKFF